MSELDGLWLFGELAQADRALVLRSTHRHRYPAGTYLYHAGELGDSLHIVVKGRLAALAGTDLSEPMMLNLLGPGEVFGELALFNADHRRQASILAVETSECLVLYRDAVQQLRQRHPQVNDMLLSVLVHRVERLTVQVGELFELDAPTRVYRQLARLGETYGVTERDGEIPLTQQQVASLAGVKLRVTNRVLNEARADGVLTTGKRRVIVHDWPTVRRRAGLRPTDT
ncbi:MAG TPA: Crp/Fnr family transcriptional regulator [Ilumatobacteraceae bacterium]|jgi:CRP-like cAMP-binding protein